ncbi:haloacid dehalogenase type II [Streptomyces sp. NPDC050560]|uniref:haloacid dehalogenase type II n=1 Tax=Streptomyces sp. NPDC050560 TaxID=3365630 RepID=UPI00378C1083
MPEVIAFDVNETLLDLRALDEPFQRLFGAPGMRTQWFGTMLQLSFVGGLTGSYVDFTTAQRAALRMLAERERVALTERQVTDTVALMERLPPHPDVPRALARLAGSPLRLVALTNSVATTAHAQLAHAGLLGLFEHVVSADTVRRLKPAPEPYHEVARVCGVTPGGIRLVAAHTWDVSGALAAGCHAAFVGRPGAVPSPLGPRPDIVAPDIATAADLILERDAGGPPAAPMPPGHRP